jgi:hypothetical protein
VEPPETTPAPAPSGLAPFDRAKATAKVNAAAAAAASQCKAQKNPDAGVETFTGNVGFRPEGSVSTFMTGVGGARICVSKLMRAVSYGAYQEPPGTDPAKHVESVKYTVTVH